MWEIIPPQKWMSERRKNETKAKKNKERKARDFDQDLGGILEVFWKQCSPHERPQKIRTEAW